MRLRAASDWQIGVEASLVGYLGRNDVQEPSNRYKVIAQGSGEVASVVCRAMAQAGDGVSFGAPRDQPYANYGNARELAFHQGRYDTQGPASRGWPG